MSNIQQVEIPQAFIAINEKVENYLQTTNLADNLSKSYVAASTVAFLRENMNKEFMAPIMALQGVKIGFLTDKDKKKDGYNWVKGEGYPLEVVRDVCIDALMNGFRLTGNEFNIIGGNFYPTREGFERVLNEAQNLDYDFECSIIKINAEGKSADVSVTINYNYNGDNKSKVLTLNVKADQYASNDSIIGKAKRKAGCWLVNKLKGTQFADGDATETGTYIEVKKSEQIKENELNVESKLKSIWGENKSAITKYASTLEDVDKKANWDTAIEQIERVISKEEKSNYDKMLTRLNKMIDSLPKE